MIHKELLSADPARNPVRWITSVHPKIHSIQEDARIDPIFGNKLDGIEYIDRPGAYAVIVSHDRQIAVIETGNGYYLPGGGIDPGETETEALERELMEETGFQATVLAKMGTALEYIHASREGKYYQIRSSFYHVQLGSRTGTGMERDHRLIWMPLEQASRLLVRESQVWAIRKFAGTS